MKISDGRDIRENRRRVTPSRFIAKQVVRSRKVARGEEIATTTTNDRGRRRPRTDRKTTPRRSHEREEDLNPLFPGPAFQVQYPDCILQTQLRSTSVPTVAGCPFKQKKEKI